REAAGFLLKFEAERTIGGENSNNYRWLDNHFSFWLVHRNSESLFEFWKELEFDQRMERKVYPKPFVASSYENAWSKAESNKSRSIEVKEILAAATAAAMSAASLTPPPSSLNPSTQRPAARGRHSRLAALAVVNEVTASTNTPIRPTGSSYGSPSSTLLRVPQTGTTNLSASPGTSDENAKGATIFMLVPSVADQTTTLSHGPAGSPLLLEPLLASLIPPPLQYHDFSHSLPNRLPFPNTPERFTNIYKKIGICHNFSHDGKLSKGDLFPSVNSFIDKEPFPTHLDTALRFAEMMSLKTTSFMFDLWSKRASAHAVADDVVPRPTPVQNTSRSTHSYRKFTTFKRAQEPSPAVITHHPPSPIPFPSPRFLPSLPAMRHPKPGNEIVNNPFRPNVRAVDRLHAWTTPYSQTKRIMDSTHLNPIIYESAELLWSKGIVDASKSNYAAGLLRFSQFCDRMGVSEQDRMPASEVLISGFMGSYSGKCAGSTMRAWLSGLRQWHILHGAPWYGDTPRVSLGRKTANLEGSHSFGFHATFPLLDLGPRLHCLLELSQTR
ncbi:hypothetical protein F5890DRAFT_1595856, partial [Lentinula detonsa]